LAITTALNKEDHALIRKTINVVTDIASQFAVTMAATQQLLEEQQKNSTTNRNQIMQAIFSYSELISFF